MAETKSVVEKSSRHVWECQVKSSIRGRQVYGHPRLRLTTSEASKSFGWTKSCLKIRNPNIMTKLLSTSAALPFSN